MGINLRLKLVVLFGIILVILALALFGSGIKEKAQRGIVNDIPEYNCGSESGELCTSCVVDSNSCSCGEQTCDCGDITVDKKACELY